MNNRAENREFCALAEAKHIRAAGVTLEQIAEELNYRDNAGIEAPENFTCGWDDNLCEYTTAELQDIELYFEKLEQAERVGTDGEIVACIMCKMVLIDGYCATMWSCERCGEQFCNDCKPVSMEHESVLCDDCCNDTERHMEGLCPNCGGECLEYGASGFDDALAYYEWKCEDCGATGRELYTLTFLEHDNIQRRGGR